MEKVVAAAVVLVLCAQVQAGTLRFEVFAKHVKPGTCELEHESERFEYVRAARCAAPRDLLLHLPAHQSHLQITPRAVFVKQCVGVCYSTNKQCVPRTQREIMIPVRYHDVSTGKEWCAHYPVTEHVSCGCARLQ